MLSPVGFPSLWSAIDLVPNKFGVTLAYKGKYLYWRAFFFIKRAALPEAFGPLSVIKFKQHAEMIRQPTIITIFFMITGICSKNKPPYLFQVKYLPHQTLFCSSIYFPQPHLMLQVNVSDMTPYRLQLPPRHHYEILRLFSRISAAGLLILMTTHWCQKHVHFDST